MILNLAIGFISRIFDHKLLPLVALFWLAMNLILNFYHNEPLTFDIFFKGIIEAAIVYLWLIMLKGAEDSPVAYLLLLVLGAYALTYL